MFSRRRFDPVLHASIASILTGFAALVLSLQGYNCNFQDSKLDPPPPHALPHER